MPLYQCDVCFNVYDGLYPTHTMTHPLRLRCVYCFDLIQKIRRGEKSIMEVSQEGGYRANVWNAVLAPVYNYPPPNERKVSNDLTQHNLTRGTVKECDKSVCPENPSFGSTQRPTEESRTLWTVAKKKSRGKVKKPAKSRGSKKDGVPKSRCVRCLLESRFGMTKICADWENQLCSSCRRQVNRQRHFQSGRDLRGVPQDREWSDRRSQKDE